MVRRGIRLILCIALMVIAVLLTGYGHVAYWVAAVALLFAAWELFRAKAQ
jgi:hypothetical protein